MRGERYSRWRAKTEVMAWCSAEPQPGELYFVWRTENKYRYPEIWVMARNTAYHRYVFEAHQSASIIPHLNGIEIVQRLKSEAVTVAAGTWNSLRRRELAVYKGQRIRNDTRTANT